VVGGRVVAARAISSGTPTDRGVGDHVPGGPAVGGQVIADRIISKRAMAGRVRHGRPASVRQGTPEATSARTAEQRWRAAVAAVPLESPRPFPAALRPLVRRYAGNAERPSYTTGPRTRRALAAAGALGATTGTVVHLPESPSDRPSVVGVLAHELTHTRQPVTRPRFLLRSATGAVDSDEHAARSAGRAATVRRWPDLSADPAGALSTAAGVVDQLPVGGAGAASIAEAAATAARAAVAETIASMPNGASMASAAGGAVNQALRQAEGLAPAGMAADPVRNLAAQSTVAGQTVDQVATMLAGAGQTVAGGIDIDRITRELEQRLLREIERRGGRYAGVF
jgi:Domain of unknown function (DUF4157)